MKVLFVSRYVDPFSIGANKNVYLQAQSLKRDFGVNIEILTWPKNDLWTGPMPQSESVDHPLTVERGDLVYHVFRGAERFDVPGGGAVLSQADWHGAVALGIRLLTSLKPSLVHLQHRHGLWWILESAQRLGIPTVYTNHDWGIACMRTVLVMGDNSLCDGVVSPHKCAACVKFGRTSLLGRMNEALVSISFGEFVAKTVIKIPLVGQEIKKRGFVTQRAEARTQIHYQRATRVLTRLSHCFTPSRFGAAFFSRLGCPSDRISVLPWYHDPVSKTKKIEHKQPFTITYIGRVSPEKGVDLLFSALEQLRQGEPLLLRIAGSNDSAYCLKLRKKYQTKVGIHSVEWLGWSQVEPLLQTTDVIIIPSQGIDNTPLSLIESLSYQTPVIATRVPPIEEFLIEGETGYLADYLSIKSLTSAIQRAVKNKEKIRSGIINFPAILGIKDYLARVVDIYKNILLEAKRYEA